MKKNLLAVGLALLCLISTHAQSYDTTTYYGKMNFIYNNLDRSLITTGLLKDYGIDFLNLENYNGKVLHDSNWVTLQDWRSLYATIYSEQVNSTAHLLYLDTLNRLFDKLSALGNPTNFIVSYYNYQGLDSNAV
jgi:hypothetical protein